MPLEAQPFAVRNKKLDGVVLLAVMLVSAIYVGSLLRTGWVPSDEGTLAQSALRVYQGQLPHRDFAEIYTGGLSFIHAAAFHLFGVNLFSLRIAAFVFFMAWLPAVYSIASRFVSPLWAGVATLTAVSWSYPNYVAAMPSWYNLFFATFGAVALLRYLDVGRWWWLFVAGLCGGCSVLIKVVGLYYIAAVLLFLLFMEQSRRGARQTNKSSSVYRVICAVLLSLYLAGLTLMVWLQLHDGEMYHFLLPSVGCVALLLWNERHRSNDGASSMERFGVLFGLLWPFCLGIVLVCASGLIPYALTGSLGQLWRGIFRSTAMRMSGLGGKIHAPGITFLIYGLVTFALILVAMYAEWSRTKKAVAIVGAMLAAVLACSIFLRGLQDTWMMAGMLTPLTVLLGVGMVVRAKAEGIGLAVQQQIVLLIFLAALCSLVQYPFPYVTYFCYAAPLTLLALVACVSARRNLPGKMLLGVLLVFFLGMGVFCMVGKHVYDPELDTGALKALSLPRGGGLRVDEARYDYDVLVPFLQAHSANGLLYAGNDCPELYFLSGLKNPTRDDTGAQVGEVLTALHSGKLKLVVFNDESQFESSAVPAQLRSEVTAMLPNSAHIGRFSIYWR